MSAEIIKMKTQINQPFGVKTGLWGAQIVLYFNPCFGALMDFWYSPVI